MSRAGSSYLLQLGIEKEQAVATGWCRLLQLSRLGYLLARLFTHICSATLVSALMRVNQPTESAATGRLRTLIIRCLQVPIFSVDNNPALTGAWLLMMISVSALEARAPFCCIERRRFPAVCLNWRRIWVKLVDRTSGTEDLRRRSEGRPCATLESFGDALCQSWSRHLGQAPSSRSCVKYITAPQMSVVLHVSALLSLAAAALSLSLRPLSSGSQRCRRSICHSDDR